jgi:hypothetical protein
MANINKKSFVLVNRVSQKFSIMLSGFIYAVTFIFRIRPIINLSFIVTSLSKITQTINVKKIAIVISKTKLIANTVQTLNAKKISVIATMKELGKISIIMTSYSPIIAALRGDIKSYSSISNGLELAFSPIYAKFTILLELDSQTLGDLDILTLGDIDYTLV